MRWTRIVALLLLVAPAACSKQQLGHFAHDLCKGLSNCTAYDADGEPSRGWDPRSRPEPHPGRDTGRERRESRHSTAEQPDSIIS